MGASSSSRAESFCPLCFIVPTDILRRIAASSDPALAEAAGRTLRLTQSLRQFRAQLSTGAPAPAARRREGFRQQIFDCKNFTDLPGDLVALKKGSPSGDEAVDEAAKHTEQTWSFYHSLFGRESLDGHGKTLTSSVHFDRDYDNAFWNGQQMVYGDGDGVIFRRFTASLDVIAHELTHGVTQFSAQLDYNGQSGALNESMSDVFGSMVKQWALGQNVMEADWLIGAEIMGDGFKGRALRDMENPGTAYVDDPNLGHDPQPAHMDDYVRTERDNGGVHINSGIPNRAFVLAAKAIGGKSWEKTGKIWYVTLTERLHANADFRKCAAETVSVARDLYPHDPAIAAAVAQAWTDVGVAIGPSATIALETAQMAYSLAGGSGEPIRIAAADKPAQRRPHKAAKPKKPERHRPHA